LLRRASSAPAPQQKSDPRRRYLSLLAGVLIACFYAALLKVFRLFGPKASAAISSSLGFLFVVVRSNGRLRRRCRRPLSAVDAAESGGPPGGGWDDAAEPPIQAELQQRALEAKTKGVAWPLPRSAL